MQKYEKGQNRVAVATLLRIAASLETSVLEFLPPPSRAVPVSRAALLQQLQALCERLTPEDIDRLVDFAAALAATGGAQSKP